MHNFFQKNSFKVFLLLFPILITFAIPAIYLVYGNYKLSNEAIVFIDKEVNGVVTIEGLIHDHSSMDSKLFFNKITAISEESNLILDPRIDTYYWALLTTKQIPEILLEIKNVGTISSVQLKELEYSLTKTTPICVENCTSAKIINSQFSDALLKAVVKNSLSETRKLWDEALSLFKSRLNFYRNFEIRKRNKSLSVEGFFLLFGFFYLAFFGRKIILKEQNASLQSLMLNEAQSNAKIGSWSFNIETQEQVWSSEHYKMFEISEPQSKEKLYQLYRERIHPEDLIKLDNFISRAIEFGEDFVFDYRAIFDNGARVKNMQGIGNVKKDLNGNVVSLSGTCQDLTELVALQVQVEVERMKSAHNSKLASLGEMAAAIAHEINNPLAIIAGNMPLIAKFRNDDTKFNSKLDTIKKSAERIEKIVKGLKKFSRTADGSIHKPETIANLVSESLILTLANSKRHSTPIETHIDPELRITCDSVEIEQVLVNLINNGIDAVKTSNERWIKINAFSEGAQVVLQVIDSGQGITVDIEKKLFQPFFTTKVVGEGTGLGLSISKGILDSHKASLALNRSFKNTCFEIRFTKADQSEVKNAA